MRSLIAAAFFGAAATSALAEDLTLLMPQEMVESGFHKHILPRFKFKYRLSVTPVTDGEADMVIGADGTRIFQNNAGGVFKLAIQSEDDATRDQAAKFLKWLQSSSGKAAIEGFKPDGEQVFTTEVVAIVVEAPETFDGNTVDGSRLALVHCGRCHVIDERTRMGGIGSTPSFAAMRAREDWSNQFRAFYVHNPHPSFTQVEGVTDPFDPNKQLHVAPMDITLEEIEAITAFVAKMKPKDLGRPIQQN